MSTTQLKEEQKQSEQALSKGDSLHSQTAIITACNDWYLKTAKTTQDIVKDNAAFNSEVKNTQKVIDSVASKIIEGLVKRNSSLTSENK